MTRIRSSRYWSPDTCDEAMEKVKEELIVRKEVVEVKSKRQNVAEAFKKTLRDLSLIYSHANFTKCIHNLCS